MIEWINSFIEKQKTKAAKKRFDVSIRTANEMFQITEYKGKLWFTYNGHLFCPCNMLVGSETQSDYVKFICKIREMYVERII